MLGTEGLANVQRIAKRAGRAIKRRIATRWRLRKEVPSTVSQPSTHGSTVAPRPFSMFEFVTTFFGPANDSPAPIMLDVGAQRGQFSRRFAELGYDVRAFEASPPNFAELSKLVENIPNVTPVNVAVSDEDGSNIRFYYSEEFIGINSLKVNSTHLSDENFATVEAVRLSSYLAEQAANVEVIKTDIEGADLLALRGFDFAQFTPRLVVSEYGGRSSAFGYDVGDLVAHMAGHGYQAWCTSYPSSTGLPFSAKTGQQQQTELQYFGRFEDCPDPNWGDVVFFRQQDHRHLAGHLSQFDLGSAAVRL